MLTLRSTLCITLLLSLTTAQAKNLWMVNLTNNTLTSAKFVLFHKTGKGDKQEIVGSLNRKGEQEIREFTNIAPWTKSDGLAIDSFISKTFAGDRGSKLCTIAVQKMEKPQEVTIQGKLYDATTMFNCADTRGFETSLIVWGDCTVIIENDPKFWQKNKKATRFKITIENNSPYSSAYLIQKNSEKAIGNWATTKENKKN